MYGLIWRVLPGPAFVKLLLTLALLGGAAALLWYVVFPWADPYLPFNDVTVEGGEGTTAPAGESGGGEGIIGVDVPVGGPSAAPSEPGAGGTAD
ncbi:hypothetical protein [Marinitenerispora sediminis]|uniref:DUF4175 domain-containing protein n=1 Tax=Marinitenerispora sediminis TaxID=1931232 RepID=A0A368T8W8_9ACTN|nr:hypothetical protein [Marinitenerispora sediminis]RCV53254.1 hypothetical protein DEF23_17800 [Marinitenerispora sediminis]RCV56135.1 hypothetical protein DEF28_04115 [Marinitenerispora sediminis]RCV60866.1 hypothetical protein DEF24_05745 [Marinitenerispora sediminis]